MRYFLILVYFLCISCSNSENEITDNNPSQVSYDWTVPLTDLLGNLNPFPLAENPTLKKVNDVEGINDDQTVVVISIDGQINIYPLHFIHAYEVINDSVNNTPFIISYCPITQSTAALAGKYNNELLTFRASGILYKENLIMHDAATDTYWSQMLLTCIKGKYAGNRIENLVMIETSWKTAKTYFSNANVFTSTSITSSKNAKTTSEINNDEKVFGIINKSNIKNSDVSIYSYSDFKNGIVKHTNVSTKNDIVIGSEDLNFIVAFQNSEDLNLTVVQNEFPTILIDDFGTKYDVFGNTVEGSTTQKSLQPSVSYIASWWAWQDFYESFNFVE